MSDDENCKYFWTLFPQELKDKIFEHLSFTDIMTASFVCKDLYKELGKCKYAMEKIRFGAKDSWSNDVQKLLEKSHRKYTSISIRNYVTLQNTMKLFVNNTQLKHFCLENNRFSHGDHWIKYLNSLPSTLQYLTINNVVVPYEKNRCAYTKPRVPMMNLREVHIMEDVNGNEPELQYRGFPYAPCHALLAIGEMPELRKLIIACNTDLSAKRIRMNMTDPSISDYFKTQKFEKLETLVVGHEKLYVEAFKSTPIGIKELYLFGYENLSVIHEVWNVMSNKQLELMSILEFKIKKHPPHENVLEYFVPTPKLRSHRESEPLNPMLTLKCLILCELPESFYVDFLKAAPHLTTIGISSLTGNILRLAIQLPELREIYYEQFKNATGPNDYFYRTKDPITYYNSIKSTSENYNKNITILKKIFSNQFKCK